ncbi:16S rRNA (guanine(966)-N(2))-methyltransferase RsmD [Halomonas alkaliantarctica]|uniref:16S rRNA (guanine(966)-N(2))-methyltransferase RsmD n=1 Tax=Halomonas alkaliantarctica TaxID=232346 RepID=UPI0004AAE9E2|nr:16S rRNA (guanine(966)-N(2))-methyltransferase RsmD [Halomonas alkaliantarctica]
MKRQRSSRSSTSSRSATSRSSVARRGPVKPPGKLRIIGGDFRRRQLPVLDHPGLRPTPDRVRETLFNWLGQHLFNKRVLDLFAGTGALGFEALSRGANHVTFIERDARVAALIGENIITLGASNGRVVNSDALIFLDQPSQPSDVIFLDPPFYQGLAASCCAMLEANNWLTDEAMIYLETENSLSPEVPANWQLYRETQAGESAARLYVRKPV